MKPYLYLRGLKNLAKKIKGNENVHIGIRPYGFHGGNVLSLVVYPYLLCKGNLLWPKQISHEEIVRMKNDEGDQVTSKF